MPKARLYPSVCRALLLGGAVLATGCAIALPQPVSPSRPARAPAAQPPTQVAQAQAESHPEYVYVSPATVQHNGGGVALLLPLSGTFSATGEAVRDGFLSGHFGDRLRGQVRVYDVGASDELLLSAYQRALNDGAGFIVGPLRKESVAQLARMNPPVPVLGLNFLDGGTTVPFNFFQMGLAPEDEARAAADHATSRGLRRAVALVPDSEWGERTLLAFEQRLRAQGGTIIRAERYAQSVVDQSKLIQGLMGVAASEERHRALTAIIGSKSEFEAKRRSDIDLIFLGARAQDARLLGPQFRFQRAGDLPIYATALVYDGRTDADRAGIRFCDTPWTIGDTLVWAPQRAEVEKLPSVAGQPRLYALGRDAYRVASGLLRGELRTGDAIDGATGRLAWNSGGVISRSLDCVQIQADGLRPLGSAADRM